MFKLTVSLLCFVAASQAFRRKGAIPQSLYKATGIKYQPHEDYSRIVGGQDAEPGQFPFQLSWRQETLFNDAFHFCGAEIYDETTVITAAHCCRGTDVSVTTIAAGQYDTTSDSDDGTEQVVRVVSSTMNEGYSPILNGNSNDICVLRVDPPLEFNDYVKPVPMPEQGQEFSTDGTAIVSGWGTLSSGGPTPDILKFVEVPLVTDEACERAYGSQFDPETMLCAGEKDKDSCQGDSGGPLTCDGVLCGVVSWGIGCADGRHPGVYAKAAEYVDWVARQAAKDI